MTNALTVNRLADLQTATTKRSFQIPLENNIVKLLYFYTTFEMTAILLRQRLDFLVFWDKDEKP